MKFTWSCYHGDIITADKFPKDSIVICYPYSRETVRGIFNTPLIVRFYPFRYELQFNNAQEAKLAFAMLSNGCRELIDYIDNYKGVLTKELVAKCLGHGRGKL